MRKGFGWQPGQHIGEREWEPSKPACQTLPFPTPLPGDSPSKPAPGRKRNEDTKLVCLFFYVANREIFTLETHSYFLFPFLQGKMLFPKSMANSGERINSLLSENRSYRCFNMRQPSQPLTCHLPKSGGSWWSCFGMGWRQCPPNARCGVEW